MSPHTGLEEHQLSPMFAPQICVETAVDSFQGPENVVISIDFAKSVRFVAKVRPGNLK